MNRTGFNIRAFDRGVIPYAQLQKITTTAGETQSIDWSQTVAPNQNLNYETRINFSTNRTVDFEYAYSFLKPTTYPIAYNPEILSNQPIDYSQRVQINASKPVDYSTYLHIYKGNLMDVEMNLGVLKGTQTPVSYALGVNHSSQYPIVYNVQVLRGAPIPYQSNHFTAPMAYLNYENTAFLFGNLNTVGVDYNLGVYHDSTYKIDYNAKIYANEKLNHQTNYFFFASELMDVEHALAVHKSKISSIDISKGVLKDYITPYQIRSNVINNGYLNYETLIHEWGTPRRIVYGTSLIKQIEERLPVGSNTSVAEQELFNIVNNAQILDTRIIPVTSTSVIVDNSVLNWEDRIGFAEDARIVVSKAIEVLAEGSLHTEGKSNTISTNQIPFEELIAPSRDIQLPIDMYTGTERQNMLPLSVNRGIRAVQNIDPSTLTTPAIDKTFQVFYHQNVLVTPQYALPVDWLAKVKQIEKTFIEIDGAFIVPDITEEQYIWVMGNRDITWNFNERTAENFQWTLGNRNITWNLNERPYEWSLSKRKFLWVVSK